jgi:Lamin Tail Domain
MAGLHICRVVPRPSDSRGEYVVVANDGPTPVALTGLELTDYTRTQQHVHIIHFPGTTDGGTLMLGPGEEAFVFTGSGRSDRLPDGDLLLFAGRHAPVWNNDGDVGYLRDSRGRFLDSLTVGAPARHPNGH